MKNKLPFTHFFFLEVLKASSKKHGIDKPVTLGHLMGMVVLAAKLKRRDDGKINRLERLSHQNHEPDA